MNQPAFVFRRGEPITIACEVMEGDPTGITLTAFLKRTIGGNVPASDVAPVATMIVDFIEATDDDNAYWLLTVPETVRPTLELGRYVTDVRFSEGGAPVKVSGPAWIVINESVSG